MYSTAQTQRLI